MRAAAHGAKRRRDAALILLGPLAVTFAAAIAQQYPFRARVVLFLLPTVLLAAGAAAAFAALILPVMAIVNRLPPYVVEQFKPVLAYVQAHRQAGDRVYVYSNAYEAVARYGPQFGLAEGAYVLGVCDEHDFRPFLEDVDQFRGARRLWVIASSVPDFYPARHGIARYLQAIGAKRDSMSLPSTPPMNPVSAELYDLSDTTRLRAATAATFRVEPDSLHAFCFDWIRPRRQMRSSGGTSGPYASIGIRTSITMGIIASAGVPRRSASHHDLEDPGVRALHVHGE